MNIIDALKKVQEVQSLYCHNCHKCHGCPFDLKSDDIHYCLFNHYPYEWDEEEFDLIAKRIED